MSHNFPQRTMIFCIVLGVIGLSSFGQSSADTDTCEIKAVQPRKIVSATLTMSHLWSKSLKVDSTASDTFVVSTPDMLIAAKYCPEQIISFNFATGNRAWVSKEITGIRNLTLDAHNNKLYFSASGEIGTVSVTDGEVLWTAKSALFERNAHQVYITPNGRVVIGAGIAKMAFVDTQTGSIQNPTFGVPVNTFRYLDETALVLSGQSVQQVDISSGKPLWSTDLTGYTLLSTNLSHAYVDDRIILLRWGGNGEYVVALSRTTGHIIWEIKHRQIVSNLVVSADTIFALDSGATLILLNVEDGSVIGSVQFEPPETRVACSTNPDKSAEAG